MKSAKSSKDDPGKNVGIWIRVSTEDQAKGESPEHHERRARCYAEAKCWNVLQVYHLEAVSGKSVMGHTETQRMLGDVRTGRITGLIFSKLARLARNTKELLEFAEIFREYEAGLISLQEAIDTTTPAGRLFYTIIAAMAQWEREEIAERVAASVPIRAKMGKPLGGAAPFGYRWENRELVPDEKEGPVRRRIYELFLEHRRKKTVARLLNEAGYRTRNGSRFSDTTVDRLIRDPTAKGVRRANYTRSLGENKAWKLKPESEWVLSSVPALVDDELWARCNHLIDERKRNGRPPGPRPVHLFTGYAFCICGQKLYVPSNTPKYVCFQCRNKIPVSDLEVVFREQLNGFLVSPEDVAAHLEQADQTVAEKKALLQSLADELDTVTKAMDKVFKAYLADELTMEGFGRQNRPLDTRRAQLEEEIPRLQAALDFLRIQHLSREEILDEARDLYSRWQELSFSDKRSIVESIVDRVTVDKDEVTFDLCYNPAPHSPKNGTERQHGHRDSSRQSK